MPAHESAGYLADDAVAGDLDATCDCAAAVHVDGCGGSVRDDRWHGLAMHMDVPARRRVPDS